MRGIYRRFMLIPFFLAFAGPGYGVESCPSLQALVDSALPGAVVQVPPCIYRERIVITKPLILDGQGTAEIRGSDIWSSNWSLTDGRWVHDGAPALPKSFGTCRSGTQRCQWPEQVFYDGQPLLQVASAPVSGQFSVENGKIVIADIPTDHTVEVTVRPSWVVVRSNDVTIQGFSMKHAGDPAQIGAIYAEGFSNLTIKDCVLSDAHGLMVSFKSGSGFKLLNNALFRGGGQGGGASAARDVLIQGNHFHHNNTEDFSPKWSAGGSKNAQLDGFIFDNNEVDHNGGPGVWCDIDCINVVISNNRVHDNEQQGIFFEISNGAKIYANKAWNNGWGFYEWCYGADIVSSSSRNVEIFGNVVAWSPRGIAALSQNRLGHAVVDNIFIHTNVIVQNTRTLALLFCQDFNGTLFDPASNNRGALNLFWFPDPEGQYGRFGWANKAIRFLAEFNATPGGGGNSRYLTDEQKNLALVAAGIPPEPPGSPPAPPAPPPAPTNFRLKLPRDR
jgi:parallel beta-helix repeat protein